DRIVDVSGHEEHRSFRADRGELLCELRAAQPRHDDIGQYQIHALVNALDGGDNSFWIAIDDGEWVEWHLTVTDGEWQWQTVTDGGERSNVSFDLEAGSHTLRIKVREDGTKLDKIVITNDADVDLNQL
ncbi:MAG: hypothetical protein MI861_03625, partial [Pirellulales bacterium]|nr:hypothetical protein [Pirellulales bacterium]